MHSIAQFFNKDSRSNINFEINLYNHWGRQLYEKKEFYKAFNIFADAYYRHWEVKEFQQNLRVSFFAAMQQLWETRNWEPSYRIIEDMMALEAVQQKEGIRITNQLILWQVYFESHHRNKEKQMAITLMEELKQFSR